MPTSSIAALCLAVALGGACAESDEVTALPSDPQDDSERAEVACQPGTSRLCYGGSEATRDVGLCHAGLTTCLPDGSGFGPCQGEITPAVETCDTAGDDDCNGSTECNGVYVWAKSFGDDLDQLGARAAVDEKGNVVLAGAFSGSIDLGGGPLAAPPGGEDGFVSKLAPSGEHIFTVPLAGRAIDVVVDHHGSVYVATLEGTCVITKLNAFGDILWTKDVGGEPSMTMRLAVDPMANLVAVGRISTLPLDFGGGPIALQGEGDVYVAKLDIKGNHVFSKSFGDAGAQQADAVALDADGTIYVTGRFDGSIDIGGGPLQSVNAPDLFVAKLSPQGESMWAKGLFGDTSFDYVSGVAVEPSGDVLVAGSFAGHMSFDADTMTSPDNVESLFVAKLNESSKVVWMKHFPGQKSNGSVAADGSGNLFLTGIIDKPMDFGGGAFGENGEGYVAKLDAAGDHLWSRAFTLGEGLGKRDFMAATNTAGSMLIVTGLFQGSADFGGPPLTSEGQHDIFVTRLTP